MALRKTTAYIDPNAVRTGMVDDPKDYRRCGYAEAGRAAKSSSAATAKPLGPARVTPS